MELRHTGSARGRCQETRTKLVLAAYCKPQVRFFVLLSVVQNMNSYFYQKFVNINSSILISSFIKSFNVYLCIVSRFRMTCQKYKLLYKKKLSQKSVSDKVQKEIDKYEEILDVLNITIWRKQAEIEVR